MALVSNVDKEPQYSALYEKESTGRRLALAKWITSSKNPLTARVAINHIWMRHFGSPLVKSSSDFGIMILLINISNKFPPKGQVTGSNPVGVTSFPYVDRILPWTGALRCWLSCSHRA